MEKQISEMALKGLNDKVLNIIKKYKIPKNGNYPEKLCKVKD